MNTINFTARLLQKSQILKMDKDNNYNPCEVSIIEFDKDNAKDVSAIQKTAQHWLKQGGGYLAFDIYNDAVKKYSFYDVRNEHYLGITTQDSDYENIDADDVLGLTLFTETNRDKNELNFFEVKPCTSKSLSSCRQYKKVGSALLNYIQDTYNEKPIYLTSAIEAIDFYKKNKFKPIEDYDKCVYLIYRA